MEGLERCKVSAKIPTTTPFASKWARDLGYDIMTVRTSPSTQERTRRIFKDASTQTSSTSPVMDVADSAEIGNGISDDEDSTSSDTTTMVSQLERAFQIDCYKDPNNNELKLPEIKQLQTWRLMYQNAFNT